MICFSACQAGLFKLATSRLLIIFRSTAVKIPPNSDQLPQRKSKRRTEEEQRLQTLCHIEIHTWHTNVRRKRCTLIPAGLPRGGKGASGEQPGSVPTQRLGRQGVHNIIGNKKVPV